MPVWLKLIIVYQLKHFFADYPLQRRYMLGKFREDWGFVWWSLGLDQMVHHLTHYAIIWWCPR